LSTAVEVETSSVEDGATAALVTDRVPAAPAPPHPLRDAVDNELQQLRDADTTSEHDEIFHDPETSAD